MDLSSLKVKWEEREGDEASAQALAHQLNVSPILARILINRKIDEEARTADYIAPRLQNLPDPDALAGMGEAIARLEKAVLSHEVVGVFGDYDVDGVTSTTILSEFSRHRGILV